MKTIRSIVLLVVCLLALTSTTQVNYPEAKNKSFEQGEMLKYEVSYGILTAGEATLTVNETDRTGANGRPLYHIKGVGKTKGMFSWFFKVHDVYETYVDKEGVFPWYFVRNVNEGGYEIHQKYTFKQNKSKVVTQDGKTYNIPLGAQDILSSFYYARTLDYEDMNIGDTKTIYCFLDGEIWPLKIKYKGKETIEIDAGEFKCLKFVPIVQKGHYFKDENDVQFWISDDENHVPVLVKAKIPVGSVRLHLVDWSGLKGNLSKID